MYISTICVIYDIRFVIKSMSNTLECKRDSFSGALGGARETY